MSVCKVCGEREAIAAGYCVECSPMEQFCDDCPDFDACEAKCRRPPAIVCEDQYEVTP